MAKRTYNIPQPNDLFGKMMLVEKTDKRVCGSVVWIVQCLNCGKCEERSLMSLRNSVNSGLTPVCKECFKPVAKEHGIRCHQRDLQIVEEYHSLKSMTRVAEKYGITKARVSQILYKYISEDKLMEIVAEAPREVLLEILMKFPKVSRRRILVRYFPREVLFND